MAFREKLNNLAAATASRAGSAIESGKLSLKVNNEERKITDYTLSIGELLVDKLDAGETFDDEIMALYASIQAARDVIAGAKAELAAKRQAEEAGEADFTVAEPVCSACGAAVGQDAKFCSQCGAKLEAEPLVLEAAEEVPPAAPAQEEPSQE